MLASDEKLHESALDYPSFGDSATSYAPPPGATRAQRAGHIYARDFYGVWSEFATAKRFEWVGKWDVERGDDRGIRRLMEKENKKTRDDYRKEYNDTVRVGQFLSELTIATCPLHPAPRSPLPSSPIRETSSQKGSHWPSHPCCSNTASQRHPATVRIRGAGLAKAAPLVG